jgi:hypothetical protein
MHEPPPIHDCMSTDGVPVEYPPQAAGPFCSRHKRRAQHLVVSLAVAASLCCQDRGEESPRSAPILIWDQTHAQDSVVAQVIARQKELFLSMVNRDSTALSTYLALDFTWGPFKYADSDNDLHDLARAAKPMEYFAVLAGNVPSGLGRPATLFEVSRPAERYAVVTTTFGADEPRISTTWRWTEDAWLATRMTQLPARNQESRPRQNRG